MAQLAKEIQLRQELTPVTKTITKERMVAFSGWGGRNLHTDEEAAKKWGYPTTVAQGLMSLDYIKQMLGNFFGPEWFIRGKVAVSFLGLVFPGDVLTARGVVKSKIEKAEEGFVEVDLEVWCENQKGEKVTAGTASCRLQQAAE